MITRFLMFALCAVLLAGCSLPYRGAQTPEQAVQQSQVGPGGKPMPMDLLGRRTLANGTVIVLHRSTHAHPDGQQFDMFGYTLVDRIELGWQTGSSGGYGGDMSPPIPFVAYGSGATFSNGRDLPIVWGETLLPEVAAVEARFSNGAIVRDDVAGGVFAFASMTALSICELRVLGEAGKELRKITIGATCSSR